MKKILLLAFIVIPFFGLCQDRPLPRTEQYCTVVAMAKPLSRKVSITVDFGELRSWWKPGWIKDEEGKIVKFNSVVDAMNYMNSQGWELVNAYGVGLGNATEYNYVMKRKITPEILKEMEDNAKKAEEAEAKKNRFKDDVYGR